MISDPYPNGVSYRPTDPTALRDRGGACIPGSQEQRVSRDMKRDPGVTRSRYKGHT